MQSAANPLGGNHLYEFCRFRFDPENHLLECEGTPILLTPKAFEILLVLVRNGSRLTTKEELMRRVWPDSFVEEANLTVNISALRRQLGETPGGQQYIETVPKKGYRFAVPVTQISPDFAATSPQAVRANETAGKAAVPAEVPSIRNGALPWKVTKETSWWRSKVLIRSLILGVLSWSVYFVYRSRV